jgi:epoxyqueuosine reductase
LLELRAEEALGWSDDSWDERLRASSLRRIRPWMWRRNLKAAMDGWERD